MYYKGGFSLGLFGIALLVMNTPYIAEASPHPDAKTFMKGGVFCFSLRQPALPQWRETLKLAVEPMNKTKKQPISLIGGLQHGVLLETSTPFEYISQLTGTASYNLSGDGLMISLSSNQAGKDLKGEHPGIWVGQIALTLDGRSLSGEAIGSKVFEPVYDGKVGQPPFFEDAVDGRLDIIDCSDF